MTTEFSASSGTARKLPFGLNLALVREASAATGKTTGELSDSVSAPDAATEYSEIVLLVRFGTSSIEPSGLNATPLGETPLTVNGEPATGTSAAVLLVGSTWNTETVSSPELETASSVPVGLKVTPVGSEPTGVGLPGNWVKPEEYDSGLVDAVWYRETAPLSVTGTSATSDPSGLKAIRFAFELFAVNCGEPTATGVNAAAADAHANRAQMAQRSATSAADLVAARDPTAPISLTSLIAQPSLGPVSNPSRRSLTPASSDVLRQVGRNVPSRRARSKLSPSIAVATTASARRARR
jgi:hypothetical protein